MKNFKYKNKEVEFFDVTGEVLSQFKSSKTHISSSVGSRYSSPTIRSNTETDHDFWIKTINGREVAVKLKDRDVQVRESQIITVISARKVGQDERLQCLLINHTANSNSVINSGRDLVDLLGLMKMTGKSIVFAVLIVIGLAAMGFSDIVYQGAGWLFLICRAAAKSLAKAKLGKEIDNHLISLSKEIVIN
jgi:hypothetical protein